MHVLLSGVVYDALAELADLGVLCAYLVSLFRSCLHVDLVKHLHMILKVHTSLLVDLW